MNVLLLSTYELGHQPVHLASPKAALSAAGHDVRAADLSVETLSIDDLNWADKVAISVPMHTALRLGIAAGEEVKRIQPEMPIAFYGLYAGIGSEDRLESLADALLVGEYQGSLLSWVAGTVSGLVESREKTRFLIPLRDDLPPISEYAMLQIGNESFSSGYVEASHGCRYRCKHCPLPVVYDGRYRIVQKEAVLGDMATQVAQGARHITFGDPDFLNGPAHALGVLREAHRLYPDVSFDITVKVEHVLKHRDIWQEVASYGVTFVVSAFEHTNNSVLEILDKGHTRADMVEATHILRDAGIEVRPTWLPFTPWTKADDLADIVEFLNEMELWGNVDPIQLAIRLLIPDGSLVLAIPGMSEHLTGRDPDGLSWLWAAPDRALDDLAAALSQIVELGENDDMMVVLGKVVSQISELTGRTLPVPDLSRGVIPRLSEPWFCCAEPTKTQMSLIAH